jgi:hypothetical protein
MNREGCTTNCVNGKLILSCPIAPAVERDLGLCNQATSFGTTSLPSGSSPAAQARTADQLMRIANMQVKMEEDLAAAELRMNPPKKAPPARTNPAFVAAGMAGIAQARAKTAQMRRDAFSHVD